MDESQIARQIIDLLTTDGTQLAALRSFNTWQDLESALTHWDEVATPALAAFRGWDTWDEAAGDGLALCKPGTSLFIDQAIFNHIKGS